MLRRTEEMVAGGGRHAAKLLSRTPPPLPFPPEGEFRDLLATPGPVPSFAVSCVPERGRRKTPGLSELLLLSIRRDENDPVLDAALVETLGVKTYSAFVE